MLFASPLDGRGIKKTLLFTSTMNLSQKFLHPLARPVAKQVHWVQLHPLRVPCRQHNRLYF